MSNEPSDETREPAIVPVEQRSIDVYGDELLVVRDEEGTVWVPVRRVCELLGVDWSGQLQRIRRDPILSEALISVGVIPTEIGRGHGEREALALPLKFVRAWLFGINATRVRAELRDKLLAYQREVIEIIDRAFTRAAPPAPADVDEARMVTLRDLARQQGDLMYQQAQLWDAMIAERRRLSAVQQLAEEHEGMIGDLTREMDQVRRQLAHVQAEVTRLQQTESGQMRLLLPPTEARISPAQKKALKALVDRIVAEAEAKGVQLALKPGLRPWAAVWASFNDHFEITKHEDLPAAQYGEGEAWLKAWLDRLKARPG